jgi:ligand-binding sensor domain-containing protein/signal transduction histidine kinase
MTKLSGKRMAISLIMSNMHYLLLLCSLHVEFSLAATPSTRFNQLLIADGLSKYNASALLIDSNGFLWAGISEGLARYDGYNFKIIKVKTKHLKYISGHFVSTIMEDSKGIFWIGNKGGGLIRFNPITEKFNHYRSNGTTPNELGNNTVQTIVEGLNGNMWVGTKRGLYNFNKQSKNFTSYLNQQNTNNSSSHTNIKKIIVKSNGDLWLGTWGGGLNYFNVKTRDLIQYRHSNSDKKSLSDDFINTIAEDNYGNLWIGTFSGGLNYFDRKSEVFTNYIFTNKKDSYGRENITQIKIDAKGHLWMGSQANGLYHFDPDNKDVINYKYDSADPYSISSDSINAITEDNNGNIWISTFYNGLNRLNRYTQYFNYYRSKITDSYSLSTNSINAIIEDEHGFIWLGTDKAGLNRFDPTTKKFSNFRTNNKQPKSINNNFIYTLTLDSTGKLWAGTNGGGLNLYNKKNNDFTHYVHDVNDPTSISNNRVRTITEDTEGNLWIGTYGGGLNRLDAKTKKFSVYREGENNSLSSDYIITAIEDSKKELWIGTRDGLNHLSPKTNSFIRYRFDDKSSTSISHDHILTLFEDKNNNIWIGTSGGGLNLFNRKLNTFTRYGREDGLPSNTIYSIEEDNNNLWISTSQGLSRFTPTTGSFRNYDINDGLQHNDFNTNASYKNKNGELFFGGIAGFNRFYPNKIIDDTTHPTLVITGMYLLNQLVPIVTMNKNAINKKNTQFSLQSAIHVTEAITLTHLDNIISFEFSALDFTFPKKYQYAYQLVGWDKDWVETNYKNRRATYTNLPSGHYVLKIKASKHSGVWNNEGTSLQITVLPPYWQTWWAFLIYAVFILIMVVAFIRVQRKKVQIARLLSIDLEKKVIQRTADIQMLAEIGKEISSNLDYKNLIKEVYRHVNNLMDATVFSIGIYNSTKNEIEFLASYRNKKPRLPYTRDFRNKNQFSVECIESREVLFSNDVHNDRSLLFKSIVKNEQNKVANSMIYVPLFAEEKAIGVLSVQSYKTEAYSNHHVELIKNIASYAATALATAESHQRLVTAQTKLVTAEKMAGLGTLTAGVAHEINNPTNFTHAAVYLMEEEIKQIKDFLRQLAGGDKADNDVLQSFDDKFMKLIELTQTAIAGTTRIKNIVEDLRTFARLDNVKRAEVNISELIKTTVHLVKTQYNSIEITTNFDYSPLINCIPSKLNQLIMNIIVNACQAILTGQGQKKEDHDCGKLIISSTKSGDEIQISFKDNGCGMDKETLQRVFEPFFTTKDVGSGTGLGMAISFGIIEEHGGHIEIESVVNEGTTIIITFRL